MASKKKQKKDESEIIWQVYSSRAMHCASCKAHLHPVEDRKYGNKWICANCKNSNAIPESILVDCVRSADLSLSPSSIQGAIVKIRKAMFSGTPINSPKLASAH